MQFALSTFYPLSFGPLQIWTKSVMIHCLGRKLNETNNSNSWMKTKLFSSNPSQAWLGVDQYDNVYENGALVDTCVSSNANSDRKFLQRMSRVTILPQFQTNFLGSATIPRWKMQCNRQPFQVTFPGQKITVVVFVTSPVGTWHIDWQGHNAIR